MHSKVLKDRVAVLEAAGFTFHPLVAVWFSEARRKIISHDAVTRRSAAWLTAWIAGDSGGKPKLSVWFEKPPTPEELEGILFVLGW